LGMMIFIIFTTDVQSDDKSNCVLSDPQKKKKQQHWRFSSPHTL
jgi:hypothetical protein